jgi:putative methionine-R-sulfoxide reductase with GAF domain
MDYNSTPTQDGSFGGTAVLPSLADLLRFTAEDDGKSLEAATRHDLESALQLLAERAQYVMGASGVAIALRDGEEMICRASAGPTAPPLETPLQVDSGLTAESIRKQQILRCDDAASDGRVDQESCRELGVKSVMVTPLLRQQEAVGVFELVAERSYAFEERDVTVLERLSQMVLTALDYADTSQRAAREIGIDDFEGQQGTREERSSVPQEVSWNSTLTSALTQEVGLIQKCSLCGFPVSASRDICLDCEKKKKAEADSPNPAGDEPSVFVSPYAAPAEHGWLASSFYLVLVMMTVVAVLWLVFKLH